MPNTRTIALVEDHALMAQGVRDMIKATDDLTFAGIVGSVSELPGLNVELDLVVLDLRLSDGSIPEDNVAKIHSMGSHVLIYTGAEDRRLIQSAAKSGALGLIRKSESPEVLLQAIRTAVAGGEVFGADWAAAIDSDADLHDARLTAREREVLALYAQGETAASVADLFNVSHATIADHVRNIRHKYAEAGRPVHSRVELYVRALEDGLVEGPG